MWQTAKNRIPNVTAESYLYTSSVEPQSYIVDGFTHVMPPNYGDSLSQSELEDLLTFLLTQKDE